MAPRRTDEPEPDTFETRCVWGGMNELEVVVRVVAFRDAERRKRMLDLLAIGLQRSISDEQPGAVDFGAALSVYGDVAHDDDEDEARR